MLDYDEIIKEKDILNTSGQESIIYCDSLYAYKIFNSLHHNLLKNKFHKVNLLSSLSNFSEGTKPIDNIMDKNTSFRGYSMDRIKGLTLAEIYEKQGIYDFILGLIDSSIKLNSIHSRPEKIILADVNCNNIILKEENNTYRNSIFIDLDNASIDGLKYNNFTGSLLLFYKPRIQKMRINQNSDRLNQLLYLITYIFDKCETIYKINMYDFDKKSEIIESLYNIRNLLRTLLDPTKSIPRIPYIYELIDAKEIKKLKLEGGIKNV